MDLLEALILCQALDKVPERVILGSEPEDTAASGVTLTPTAESRIDPVIDMVPGEGDRFGGGCRKRSRY